MLYECLLVVGYEAAHWINKAVGYIARRTVNQSLDYDSRVKAYCRVIIAVA